jgi:hypothetical protein
LSNQVLGDLLPERLQQTLHDRMLFPPELFGIVESRLLGIGTAAPYLPATNSGPISFAMCVDTMTRVTTRGSILLHRWRREKMRWLIRRPHRLGPLVDKFLTGVAAG